MNEHDDAYVDVMLMVNMLANTRSVTHMGSGGYKSVFPKWDRMEQEMFARGSHPRQ